MIDKIAGIAGMRNLKILSVGRNYIKNLAGIETVADTLEELWISYNPIDKLKGIGALKNLRVLYISNNNIKEWVEFNRLQCPPPLSAPKTARISSTAVIADFLAHEAGRKRPRLRHSKAEKMV
ncbi:unnamed protein product, partial [Iphiclides podalirius]